ncbi:50S ribosomal protein L9 [Candidatus Wolfebacteria bacterium]|nr:MAG: 50S ribosomal protein L9 [Candidatus Wolfebacteria bacterium]
MKVVLLEDVPHVGTKYDIKEVSDGYAQNFLIPKKLVNIATPAVVQQMKRMKELHEAKMKLSKEELKKSMAKIDGASVTIKEKVNETGGLFTGINAERLSEEMMKQNNINISAEHIVLKQPLKEAGEFPVTVTVEEQNATFKAIIEAE